MPALTGDGRVAAPATVQRQRGGLVNAAEYAVERRLLSRNPITDLAWKAPRTVQTVDRRVVVNPAQAVALLDAVAAEKPSGARLVAFFGAMYYAALHPAEASTLRKANLALPAQGGAHWCWRHRHQPRELMHRMGHGSMRAALIYQHATRERDRQVADRLSDLVEE